MAKATRIDFRVDKARHLLKQDQQTVLSDRDRDIFLAMLDSDAKPNAALKKAFKNTQYRTS